jgi:hypothetical protein
MSSVNSAIAVTCFMILLAPDITGDQPYTQGAAAAR